ncbi:hypothetical protein ACHQM5_023065 [Ranunculus cassubicifolius]
MTSSCRDIPEDVVFHILLWLPVISLLRFKSVCKYWRSLIQSSEFIVQHMHHHPNLKAKADLIILNGGGFTAYPQFSLTFSLLSGKTYENHHNIDLPFQFDDSIFGAKIKASCNGIICLEIEVTLESQLEDYFCRSTHICLWNPATKQFRLLPQSLARDFIGENHCVHHHGFGFDVKNNDYKVVRFLLDDRENSSRVDVYNLSSNSWRTIKVDLPVRRVISDPKAPFRNEIYCWLGFIYEESQFCGHLIVSFDFSKDVFGTILLPDPINSDSQCKLILAYLAEKIAVMDCQFQFTERGDWHCQVWVLNEYGVKESWTKLYTLKFESNAFMEGISLDGKIIWLFNAGGTSFEPKLYSCDPVTEELKILPVKGYSWLSTFAVYKETLVSLGTAHDAA